MKKFVLLFSFIAIAISAYSQVEIKRKITDSDPVTGKKMIAYLTLIMVDGRGVPLNVSYKVKYKEANETTDAVPPTNYVTTGKAYQPFDEFYTIGKRKISSTTLLYLQDDTVDPNAITLEDYFATKTILSYPGVSNGDQFWKVAEGVLRQIILIRQANGEYPN